MLRLWSPGHRWYRGKADPSHNTDFQSRGQEIKYNYILSMFLDGSDIWSLSLNKQYKFQGSERLLGGHLMIPHKPC
jgi:hypothetical protein